MKNRFRLLCVVLVASVVASCSKPTDTANTNAPDISDFSMPHAAPVVAGQSSAITVNSISLGNGTFNVKFDLSGNNADTGLSAPLVMANNSGTFYTPVLANAGETILTVRWISNSAGVITPVYYNNVIKFTSKHDSTGLMTATINGVNSFSATDLTSSLSGTNLSIVGTVWDPYTSSIVLYINNYVHAAGTFSFNVGNSTTTIGSAHYSTTGVAQVAAYGTIKVTSVSPVLAGTFSFTNADSGKISGIFSAPSK